MATGIKLVTHQETSCMDETLNAVKVSIVANTAGGGVSVADGAVFTAGTSTGVPTMGLVDDSSPSSVTEDHMGVIRMTPTRDMHVNLRNNAGTEIGSLASPARVDPVGTTAQPITDNSGSLTVDNNGTFAVQATGTMTSVGSGNFTVIQGTATNLNAQVVGAVASAGANAGNPVKFGAAYTSTQPTVTTGQIVDLQATDRGALIIASGTDAVNVTLATGTNTIGLLTANQSVNVAQIAGTTTVTGGVAGIIAVGGNVANAVTATANPVPVGGIFTTTPATLTSGQTATAQFTAAQNLKQDLATIAGTAPTTAGKIDIKGADGDVFVRQTTAANLNVTAVGGAAAGASASGNPLRTGVLGRSTLPTIVSSAQMVDVLADRYGRIYVVKPIATTATSNGTPITTNTNTQIVAAPAGGSHLRIYRLWAQNSSATGTWCYWGNGSGVKTIPFYLAQNQPFSMDLNGAWELTTATGLFLNTATTGANIEWFVITETLVD